jgi:protein-tyrosine kinase
MMSKISETLQRTHRWGKGPTRLEHVPSAIEPIPRSLSVPIPSNNAIGLFQGIEACLPSDDKKIIQFIGSRSREGVSTVVLELAKVAAERLGRSVLLLYEGRFQSAQSLLSSRDNQPSLDEFLREECSLDKVLYQVGTAPLFLADFSRTIPSVPIAQIFTSSKMLSFLEDIRSRFDVVLIDSPSLDVSADGLIIAPRVDGVVLVVEAERTPAPVARRAKASIIQSGGRLLGIVFNRKRHYIPGWLYNRL